MGIMANGTLDAEGIRGKMQIPDGFTPVAGMVAGYPHGYLHSGSALAHWKRSPYIIVE